MRVFSDAEALGGALAAEVMVGLDEARRAGRAYILGCPGGRSGRSTYRALARQAQGSNLRHLVIAMMDEYLLPNPNGRLAYPPADAHFGCRRFAEEEIAGPLRHAAAPGAGLPDDHVWLPDPSDPEAYERRLIESGGVDLFIVASGSGDGHVAFMPPGSSIDGGPAIVELPDTTRRDNLTTFPGFSSLADVPRHGVSVGLGTIRRVSRAVRLVLSGGEKRRAAARVLGATGYEPDWPATFIHRCPGAEIWLDSAARPDGAHEVSPAGDRGAEDKEVPG